ncbi:bark beetle isoform X1 [Brachionus plicatilis]|uniref:Bark beetle isoform X1 n=1 Tax=Brachionus plicatilis TaxID=10195 RepID=A0A3M7RU56_BRAPC|nr:bark beetle isoform X1 [Brachionus plicatilis]
MGISGLHSFTILSPQINNDLVLYARHSPYLASGDVIVDQKARLTIEPGSEIRLAKGRQLIVYGTLVADGTELNRIRFSKFNDQDYLATNQTFNGTRGTSPRETRFRLVEGDSVLDGKLQVLYKSKWHYVCSTQFNWTEADANVTCKSLGFSNGTFYNYSPSNNLTSHMKIFLPQCNGTEQNLFECAGTKNPELGLTVCEKQNSVGLVCEGFDNHAVSSASNWGGIVFQKHAPFKKIQDYTSVFYNVSQSTLQFVDIQFAGLIRNKNPLKPKYDFLPSSAITVFQYAPNFNNITIENSIGNGLNYSNIEAPGSLTNSIFRNNRGHGIVVKTRFGNIKISNVISRNNFGDGLKYEFNNTIWSQQEQEEYFTNRYIKYCDSQNPLSFPAYYKYKNPNYVHECTKTFSTESQMKITLHFQKIKILSQYSTYWLEVYDGQTDKNSLIANYTFQNGKTPEAIYSKSNYMFVKIKYECNFPSGRHLQPVEIKKIKLEHQWEQMKENQMIYEQNLYRHSPPSHPDMPLYQHSPILPLHQLTNSDRLKTLKELEKNLKEQNLKLNEKINEKNVNNLKTRLACPYTHLDEITMYAMIGPSKNPDLLIKHSQFVNNSLNGINATNLHSLVQLNQSLISHNHLNGLHVQAGAGDISLYHSQILSNSMNGINITYAGGLKEFNYSRIHNNALYGIYINYNVDQEFDNVFQNTTINSSTIDSNMLAGVHIGPYCNQSNITINSTIFSNNQENGLVIESCDQDRWYVQLTPNLGFRQFFNRTFFFTNLNISWNLFDSNRLNGLKIAFLQNMVGIVTNNTFQSHKKGAMLITANHSRLSMSRNVSLLITNNLFRHNSGRYCINIGSNNLADIQTQSVNVTYNKFENNFIFEPYDNLAPRSSASAVAVISSQNVKINFNIFDNPQSRVQIATGLTNFTSRINASYNWLASLQPVYDLHYFMSHKEKCNQQWLKVRNAVFDNSNRSNLAQIIYWPFSCNQRLWHSESSSDLRPPVDFNLYAAQNFGGVYDLANSVLPSGKYTVVNDILVKPGAKLTIKSGAELNFLNGVGILVLGELHIDGHFGAQVKLTASRRSVRFVRSLNQTSSKLANGSSLPKSPFSSSFRVDLVDGRNSMEGRLRLETNGKFGTVCNKGWTMQNSKIVCQQMGLVVDPNFYIYSKKLYKDHRLNEAILMSEVQCDRLDINLFECRHTSQSDHTCTHDDDVWLKCLRPSWAGIRFGMASQPSSLKYAIFEQAGQYDYHEGQVAPALHFDLLRHELSNLTFEQNEHTSVQVVFNQPNKFVGINNLNFGSNSGVGLVTRSGYITINQLNAVNNLISPVVEIDPYMDAELLSQVRLYGAEPRRGTDVRQELTRIRDNQWFIGAEEMVFLYTDTEYEFGPVEFSIQIKTDNNRVLVLELVDFNPNLEEEQVVFCERLCQNDYIDLTSRQWNMSVPETFMYFPINTSYSVLNVNYNVTTHKSGRLSFIVYSMKAPEHVYDYKNPTNTYVRNLMPENVIKINNSTFFSNRHSIVMRHYDETLDLFGNLRKRYNYTNLIVSNSSFTSNDQIFWMNTDPHHPKINPRVYNLTFHEINSLTESNKDDSLIAESGYQIYDLVPNVKKGPLSRINITFENCIFDSNFGGIRSIYRYHEYSNSIFNYEIRNNKFTNNHQSILKIFLPRLYRYAIKKHYQNLTHTFNIRNNQFSFNSLFELSIDGHYAQINMTKNLFTDNQCRLGLVKLSGSEKHFFIYSNRINDNTASFIFDLEAKSHADNSYDYPSLLVENQIYANTKPHQFFQSRQLSQLLVPNYPFSYTVALRGIQNCTMNKNYFENPHLDYELVGALATNTLNTTIDASYNYWGSGDSNVVSTRIFDFKNWNNHAIVNFLPFIVDKAQYSLSKRVPDHTVLHGPNVLGGMLKQDLTLTKLPMAYQVVADLTILPGATLYINPGVEIEFYPNVGILVLGDLRASGRLDDYIKMRPVQKIEPRVLETQSSSFGQYLKIRFFHGLNQNEGFLQIFNESLRSWTFTCDPQFTLETASTVCKQMSKEHRNPLVKSFHYYFHPTYQPAVWNQSFVCQGGESQLSECDTLSNLNVQSCRHNGEYTYIICGENNLQAEFEHAWGGIRFAQSHFEIVQDLNEPNDRPVFLNADFQQVKPDSSYMYYVDMVGAGKLHNKAQPSVQLIYRSPLISNCNIRNSSFHGLEFMQSKVTTIFNKLSISSSLGYAVNSLHMNSQTTDQKSSFRVLGKSGLSSSSLFSLVDICDPHKYYDLEQRIVLFYRYSSVSRDCGKIFRARLTSTFGARAKIGLRFLQFSLVNNTVLNDTVEIYSGSKFNGNGLMQSLTNATSVDHLEKFYLSQEDSLSILMSASPGREYHGFVAEVLLFPTSQYLLSDTYIELSDSQFTNNQLGAVNLMSAGERNPNVYIVRNRFVANGLEFFNTSSQPLVNLVIQNSPKFYFGNSYIANNYGGCAIQIYSGSGVLITNSIVYNNLFYANKNGTVLDISGPVNLPYNEVLVDKNLFLENETPRTDLISVSGLVSKFTRNQIIYNKAARILMTKGFQNVSAPRSQDISFNLFRYNYAYGMVNELEDANRFRSTMVAASHKQVYYSNYMFNKDNDFELTALPDPLLIKYVQMFYTTTTLGPFKSSGLNKFASAYPKEKLYGQVAHSGLINATHNYWGSVVESEIGARIRDKYDNETLFEIFYQPGVDEFKLRDGKCELGWTLIDDTCYTYIGSYVSYSEARVVCKNFESRLARETVAPIKLPRFRKLARSSQFDYETQSYRKMWLHTESYFDNQVCSVIDDFGTSSLNCDQKLPFICEKDPVFAGAAFRFKDEIAFAIAALAALVLAILVLSLLSIYKSRTRKKEHIHRQNTLRTSARTNRHMINSGFSTLKTTNNVYASSDCSLNEQGSISAASRSTGIYHSQRNQYFMNKKQKKLDNMLPECSSQNSSPTFNTLGLDSNYSNFKSKLNQSVQYHDFDASPIKYGELDEANDTISDELSEETAVSKLDSNRLKSVSPKSNLGQGGHILEKEFIHAKLVKQGCKIGSHASYDQLMNNTMNDTDEDLMDSKRLLTNRINTSSAKSGTHLADGADANVFSNVSPKLTEYENLSHFASNEPLARPGLVKRGNAPAVSPRPQVAPPPPKNCAPQLLSQFRPLQHPSDTDDTDSLMSAQLITSASLLANRDSVKEAKRIPGIQVNAASNKKTPAFNPRTLKTHVEVNQSHDVDVQSSDLDADANKPPPMETAI